MTYDDRMGAAHESMVDMNKIIKLREFMTRKVKYPVYGTEQCYNRLADKIQFSNENMALLSQSLDDPSRLSNPKDL